ncbi:MAG: peroxiredoxin [Hyphomicrobiales bacterium]|nr:peroxiredoxin [Hyphomicrobiales bacterium]
MGDTVSRAGYKFPDHAPRPVDDGAASHLPGIGLPPIGLKATTGETVRLDRLIGRTIVFVYVRSRLPGQTALFDYWDTIPGATGCTVESCGFRDLYLDFIRAGARIFGLSAESPSHQKQASARLNLPFPLLSDERFDFAMPMRLPMLDVNEYTFLKRLTFVAKDGVIERVFYPVFPPDTHADEVLAWLRTQKR